MVTQFNTTHWYYFLCYATMIYYLFHNFDTNVHEIEVLYRPLLELQIT